MLEYVWINGLFRFALKKYPRTNLCSSFSLVLKDWTRRYDDHMIVMWSSIIRFSLTGIFFPAAHTKDFLGKSDPYLEFAKQNPDGTFTPVHTTEVSWCHMFSHVTFRLWFCTGGEEHPESSLEAVWDLQSKTLQWRTWQKTKGDTIVYKPHPFVNS